MKLSLFMRIYFLCAMLALGSSSFAQQSVIFEAILNGRHVVQPLVTPAVGDVSARLQGTQLVVTGKFRKLSSAVLEDGINIHFGLAGQNGQVVLGLIPNLSNDGTSGTIDAALNTFTVSETVIAQLNARQLYIEITTASNPGGEIRGQLTTQGLTAFATNLYGSNEVPSVSSLGTGALLVELVSPSQIVVTGSFQNLEGAFDATLGGGANLHLGLVGRTGNVTINLNPTVNVDLKSGVFTAENNTFTISTNQLIALGERKIYANVYSTKYPTGEIRGQFVPVEASNVFRSFLSPTQTVPTTSGSGDGIILAESYSDTLLILSGGFTNMSSPFIANSTSRPGIYTGMSGELGNFSFPVNLSALNNTDANIEATNNVFLMNAQQARALFGRGMYVNIGSLDFLTGELRGQLLPESQVYRTGMLSGILTVPPANTLATGNLQAELMNNQLTISGTYNNLIGELTTSPVVGIGFAGSVMDTLFTLTPSEGNTTNSRRIQADNNTFSLTDEQVALLLTRQLHITIPSDDFPKGELRTQLLPEANAYYVATLSGSSQPHPVVSTGSGQAIMEVRSTTASLSGSFNNLREATVTANLHNGIAGRIGDVIMLLKTQLANDSINNIFLADSNTITLTNEMVSKLSSREEYINITTPQFPNGAIRGQLLPFANNYFTTTLSGFNQVLPVRTSGTGALKLDLIGNRLTVTGSFDSLGIIADTSAALFVGAPGTIGAFELPLDFLSEGATNGAVLKATDNVFLLTPEQVLALQQEDMYFNINTETALEGEIRGQILHEPNAAPSGITTFELPLDGEIILSQGDPTSLLRAKWTVPKDNNEIYYVFQTSEFVDFRSIDDEEILVGQNGTFDYTLAQLDSFLIRKGIEIGDSISRYYRLVASDGALSTVGKSNFVTIKRSDITRTLGIDLEVSITAPEGFYERFREVPYVVKVVNKGPQAARDIFVSAPIPQGMTFTRATATHGRYNSFFRWWQFDRLEAGDTATLNLTLFTLKDEAPITNFVEVLGALPKDVDSTPDNGEAPTPREDDEAVVTIFTEPVVVGGDTADLSLLIEVVEDNFTIFSNTTYILKITNNGPDSAANIKISALIPEGMVFTSANATVGNYRIVPQDWVIPFLRSGETAELELVLFTLVEGRPIILFAQIIESDQTDPDSTPANDLDNVPDEDDEASVLITPTRGIMGGDSSDLELKIAVDRDNYEVFTNYVYTFTLTNKGPDAAANIFVDAQLPDSLAFTSKAASIGTWNNFFQYWFVPYLEADETHTLKLNLFTLARQTSITYFTQIIGSDQDDIDSTPNNNFDGIPKEDDEATVTIGPLIAAPSFASAPNKHQVLEGKVYPVPASDFVSLMLQSEMDQNVEIAIVNMDGYVLSKQKMTLHKGTNSLEFDIRSFQAGTYTIWIGGINSNLVNWQFLKVN